MESLVIPNFPRLITTASFKMIGTTSSTFCPQNWRRWQLRGSDAVVVGGRRMITPESVGTYESIGWAPSSFLPSELSLA